MMAAVPAPLNTLPTSLGASASAGVSTFSAKTRLRLRKRKAVLQKRFLIIIMTKKREPSAIPPKRPTHTAIRSGSEMNERSAQS